MSILTKTKCYLAGNLEYSSDSYDWREYVKKEFKPLSIICLDPTEIVFVNQPSEKEDKRDFRKKLREEEKYDELSDSMKEVVRKDLRCLDVSDFNIFNFQIDKPTFGTMHELIVSYSLQKKPTFVSVGGDKKKTPLWFFGMMRHKYIYNSVEEIVDIIKKIHYGSIKIDSDRWRLLKPEYR